MVHKFLADIGIDILEDDIDKVVQSKDDQRSIMGEIIRLVADRLEITDEGQDQKGKGAAGTEKVKKNPVSGRFSP